MDYIRPFSSYVVQTRISVSGGRWLGSIRFHWLWSSLGLSRLIEIVIPVILELWVFRLQFSFSQLWRLILGHLNFLEAGFVSYHARSLGGARLIVQSALLAGCILFCFRVWVRTLCGRLVHALMLGEVKLAELHIWSLAMLFHFIWRLLVDLVFLELPSSSFLLLEWTFLWPQQLSYPDTSSHGAWIRISMMRLCASFSAGWIELFLPWGSLSFWPTMIMVRLRLSIYVKKMFHISSEDRFATPVFWVPPLVLLSLVLNNMYAQILECLCPASCWHLLVLHIFGDEVKRRFTLAYEDRFPEANLNSPFLHVLRSDMRRVVSKRQWDNWLLGQQTIRQVLVGLFLLNRMPCFLFLFVQDVNVNWFYECINFLLPFCHICSGRIVAQPYSVPGPCLLALEWHRKMLGYALKGLGFHWCLDSCIVALCFFFVGLWF